ncbi:CPBP family intramembrane glutamic endopeptidase [Woodsholea maritima]|uniref:CPBP family intramembrane glutamic endopeptidase n=1 Tax=Woodsholea maritima TaxID=240237 RepID=UPI0003752B9F|nr:CPBP family intramembrane glutamic endopeptidase [Woodsholea maritima]
MSMLDLSALLQQPSLVIGLGLVTLFLVFSMIKDLFTRAQRAKGVQIDRLKHYNSAMVLLWSLALICLICWHVSDLSWAQLGFRLPTGWRAWISWGLSGMIITYLIYTLIAAALHAPSRISMRQQFETAADLDLIRPRTEKDHARFQGLSLTAGITEEIVFRGFMIGALALIAPLWLAAIFALIWFILGHVYQGLKGMITILPISILLTVIFVIGQSLWPVILVHVLVDMVAGGQFKLVDAFEEKDAQMSPA